jgi:hypothetical protein
MDKEELKYLVDVAQGRVPRDQAKLDQLAREGRAREATREAMLEAEREKSRLKTPEEVERAVREFNLKTYGRVYAETHKRKVREEDPLFSDLKVHSAEGRPEVPARLRMQCHSGEPIRQVLKTY